MKEFFSSERWLQAAAFTLRYQVFVLEQHIPPTLEFDTLDDISRNYYVLFEKQQPIATIRYQKLDALTLQPDRLCVAKSFRKQGLGKRALQFIEKQGQAEGCRTSILSAEIVAKDFYTKLGYQQLSKPYLEDGILCIEMKKQLAT